MAKKVVTKANAEATDLENTIGEVTPEEEIEEVEEAEVTEAPEVKVNTGANVKIKVNQRVECYIGDTFYRIGAGEEASVPKNVKDILKNAGYLEAL